MNSMVLRLVLAVLVVVPVARCGGVITSPSDGGAGDGSAAIPCGPSGGCPTGYGCFFPISEGCGAVGQCLQGVFTNCKAGPACTCDGKTELVTCGPPGYAKKPVQYTGQCKDGGVVSPPPCASGLACELCDVSGYAPTLMSPPATMSHACTSQELAAFATACLGSSASQQTCQSWQTAQGDAGTCLPCLFTLQSSAAWGPVVCSSSSCSVNTAGCVDLALAQVGLEKAKGGPGSCGDLVNASYGCQDYACGTCASSDFNTCVQSALANECKPYGDALDANNGPCAMLQGDASSPTVCFPSSDTDIPGFLNVFCGTGP
jgi:hypothetical protein